MYKQSYNMPNYTTMYTITKISILPLTTHMEPQNLEIATAITPNIFGWSITTGILLLAIRDMIRKGIALWKAGTKKQMARFVVMFVVNTVGVLPIIYLIFFQKKEKKVK